MQFAPEVEERFRRIEDAHAVTAELLRRFELETKRLQDAMGRWVEHIALQVSTLADAQLRNEETMRRLEETGDRFLKSRTNGGAGN
jgi:hypothetical protein